MTGKELTQAYTRREFLASAARITGTLAVGSLVAPEPLGAVSQQVPRRVLGRTEREVSIVGLGLGPLGIAGYSCAELQAVVRAALQEGINYFDVQPDYGESERYLAPLLEGHREDIFVVTKTWEQSKKEALASIEESARRMRVEYIDAVLLNMIVLFDLERLFTPDGALAALQEARKEGWVRFLGVSAHMGVDTLAQVVDSGEFDIVMPVVNFVDRHTYNFEEKVLPVALKHQVGVAAMKVLGGAVDLDYSTPQQRALLDPEAHETAIHYALSMPGVCTAVIGCKSIQEVRRAAQAARRFRTMDSVALQALSARGRQLAAEWGEHLGPV